MRKSKSFTPNISNLNRIFTPAEKILHLYFEDVRKYEPLSKEVQDDLFLRYRAGDKKALDKLVLHNLRWVISASKRFNNDRVSINDLVSEGTLGLIEGIEHYDITKDVKLYSYCAFWIRKRLINCMTDTTVVRAPQNRSYSRHRVERVRDYLYTYKGDEPTEEEIYEVLRDKHTSRAVKDGIRELDNKVHLHGEINDETDSSEESGHKNFFWEDCETVLDNETELYVIRNTFGFNCEPREKEYIAENLEISEDEVDKIYKKALSKLKKEFDA